METISKEGESLNNEDINILTNEDLRTRDIEIAMNMLRRYVLPLIDAERAAPLAAHLVTQFTSSATNIEERARIKETTDFYSKLIKENKSGFKKLESFDELKLSDALYKQLEEEREILCTAISENTALRAENDLRGEMYSEQCEALEATSLERDTLLNSDIFEKLIQHEEQIFPKLPLVTRLGKEAEQIIALQDRAFKAETQLKSLEDAIKNQEIYLTNEKKIAEISSEEFKRLSCATAQLPVLKKLESVATRIALQREVDIKAMSEYVECLEEEVCARHGQSKDLNTKLETIMKENHVLKENRVEADTFLSDALSKKHFEVAELSTIKDRLLKEKETLTQRTQDQSDDNEFLRRKIKRYQSQRNNSDKEEQTCKVCGDTFMQSTNFSWSCRTHQSEYGGSIWWCCGKQGKDAIGCQFARHLVSNENELEKSNTKQNFGLVRSHDDRCYCCLERDHSQEECPKNPNFNSSAHPLQELARINAIKNMGSDIEVVRLDGFRIQQVHKELSQIVEPSHIFQPFNINVKSILALMEKLGITYSSLHAPVANYDISNIQEQLENLLHGNYESMTDLETQEELSVILPTKIFQCALFPKLVIEFIYSLLTKEEILQDSVGIKDPLNNGTN